MDLDCHFDCGNPVVCLYYELILKELRMQKAIKGKTVHGFLEQLTKEQKDVLPEQENQVT